jgi:23S rRNA (uracil1939-C5)-methyltransferase
MSKQSFTEIKVSIEKLSTKGYGIGFASKTESSPLHKVEVPHTVVGDEVLVEIGRKKAGRYIGYFPKLVTPSVDRVEPRCRHASVCGGCSWQQISYTKQLELKQKAVFQLFSSCVDDPKIIFPIIPCDSPWYYRNKMEYTFSQNKSGEKFLGLIMTHGKGRVINIEECHLTDPWFTAVLTSVKGFWDRSSLLAYHMRSNQGTLRNLTLRSGLRSGRKLVMLTVSGDPSYAMNRKEIDDFVSSVLSVSDEKDKGLISIFLRIQQIHKGMPTQFFEMHLAGPDHLIEDLYIGKEKRKFSFKISPTAFFQPNTHQAEKLYSKALEMAKTDQPLHALDLYAGTSTLGILFSSLASRVTSIEINPHATFDAEVNKEWNQIENLTVKKGDVAEVLAEMKKDPSFMADLIVVDPPRSGLDAKAIDQIVQLSPKKIIYISCNPNTQAENVKSFLPLGYKLEQVQPVDQFPHTVHCENICLLVKSHS